MKVTGGRKRLIIGVIVITLLIGGVLLFPGIRFLIPQIIFERLQYSPMNERLMLIRSSRKEIVKVAEDFYKKLNLPFPKINDFSKEVIIESELRRYMSEKGNLAQPPEMKILMDVVISASRRYPVARLWIGPESGFSFCIVDYRRKEVSYYEGGIASVIKSIEKGSIPMRKTEEILGGDFLYSSSTTLLNCK